MKDDASCGMFIKQINSALEKILHVAQSTAAGIINRLEQKGLVTGFGDYSDKRIKLLFLQYNPLFGFHRYFRHG